ncbi:nitroreductase family protein [Mucilaginibacter sp. HMF5004]|uniref:nitroreductase family protein n=1 Tax=Mucilaginibacter rivuli TaxID=2857527 RepID=UPI001C5E6A1B|nr:nitroreductase family protein [Mucilaginibacter rivuli]MBW4890374.1 nitroreductase family protein [Mucilaginibacter rivuli]
MSFIEKLNKRYAVKKFDDTKKLSAQQLDDLLTAVQLSPSCLGLQQYRILVIEDQATREKLRGAAYNQQQITQASQLIVFAAETNIDDAYGKKYIDRIAETRGIDRANLAQFEQAVLGTINSRNPDDRVIWAQKQAYIALGVLVSAAADMGIDACPMEGFAPEKFDEILGLREKGLTASVIATIGYRAEDDAYSKLVKVRKPKSELFIHI